MNAVGRMARCAGAPLRSLLRPGFGLGVFLGLLFFFCQLPDVSTYPLVNADEALLNDPGLQLVRRGEFRSDVFRMLPGYADFYFWQPPGLALSAACCYKVMGFGIWQTRLPGIGFGALAVSLCYFLARRISGSNRAALFSAVLLCLWPPFVLTSKAARMDTGAISLLLAATLLVVADVQGEARTTRRLFAAGVLCGCAGLFHPISINWAGCLFVLLLVDARTGLRSVAMFVLGGTLPVLAWLGFAWRHPDAFGQQFLEELFGRTAGGSLMGRFAAEASRYAGELARYPMLALCVLLAAVGFVNRRAWTHSGVCRLLSLCCLLALAHAATAGKASGFYTLYPMTLLLCLVGIGVDLLLTHLEGGRASTAGILAVRACFGALLINGFLFAYAPRVAARVFQHKEREYWSMVRPLSERLRPGDRIWGSAVLWYAAVRSGAGLDSQPEPVPAAWMTRPDPGIQRFVVVDGDLGRRSFPGYEKVAEIRAELPRVRGYQFSDRSYAFDIYESTILRLQLGRQGEKSQ